MIKNKKIVCIIPARLQSTRFPRKVLSNLAGKPLLQWVWQAAINTKIFDEIIFAVDAEETANLIKTFGAKFLMTPENCNSGTKRLINVMESKKIKSDIWVNWQADEPLINKKMIETLLQSCHTNDADVWTLKKKINNLNEINNPNFVKVISDSENYALFFSRSPVPYYRDNKDQKEQIYYKHIGIYAFTTNALKKIAGKPISYLEKAEKLEQLSFLTNQLRIKIHEISKEVIGIDSLEDLKKVESLISKRQVL